MKLGMRSRAARRGTEYEFTVVLDLVHDGHLCHIKGPYRAFQRGPEASRLLPEDNH